MASFFISHSSQDLRAAEDLHERLRGWGFSSLFLDVHIDDGIPVGGDWEQELYAQVRSSDAIIFLGSPAAVASRWCFAELALARSSLKPVFPLWLGGDGRSGLLADQQWLDLSGGDDAYERLRRALVKLFDPRVGFDWDQRRSPYPGLKPFQPEDAAVFFGREDKIAEVLRHLDPNLGRGRSVSLIGPSGSGKSSVVRGGVIPRLRRLSDVWAVIPPFTPGERPMAALARVLAAALHDTGQEVDRRDLQRRLERDSRELVEAALDIGSTAQGTRRAVLLVIDQAEELVSIASPEQRERFVATLRTAFDGRSPLWIVATLRTEFLGTSLHEAAFAEFIDETVLLGPLDRSRLPEVIEGPASKKGLQFAPGLVARMVEDTRGGDALPLLAYTLQQLHEGGAADDRIITHEEYDAIDGVLGALQMRADATAAELMRARQGAALLPTLLKFTTLDAEGEPTRRRLLRAQLSPAEREVAEAFVEARLLTSDGPVIEVAHEALLRTWPPLREAIAASRERLRVQADLARSARDWEDAGRQDAYLLRDERFQAVKAVLTGVTNGERLEGLEGEYYRASVAFEQRTREAERRRRRRTMVALTVAFVVISVAAGTSFWQYRVARDQTDLAVSRGLAGLATATFDDKLELGMLLSVEAWRSAKTVEARSAALTALQHSEGTEAILRNPNDGEVAATAFSPIEPLLAVGGEDRAIRLWDLRTRRVRGDPFGLPGSAQRAGGDEVKVLAFSPDGRNLAAIYNFGSVVLWTIREGAASRPIVLPNQLDEADRLVFSPDSELLAATGFDTAIALWDVESGRPLRPTLGRAKPGLNKTAVSFTGRDTLVAFSEDGLLARWDVRRHSQQKRMQLPTGDVATAALGPGGRLAVLGANRELTVWDAQTGKRLARAPWPAIDVTTELVFNPMGSLLAAVTSDGRVEVLNVRSLRPDGAQPPMSGAVSVGFNANGTTLVVGGSGVTTLWSLEHRRPLSTPLIGIPGSAGLSGDLEATVAFSTRDPSRLLANAHGMLRAWTLPRRQPVQQVRVDRYLDAVATSADGSTAAFVDYDDKVRVWHLGERQPSHGYSLVSSSSLALSADGSMLATGGGADDGRIHLRDAQSGAQWGPAMRRDKAVVWALDFSPRGDLLASAGYGQVISLWKIIPTSEGTRRLEPLSPDRLLVGHTGAVNSIAFDPKGQRIVSGGSDKTVRLWDVETGQAIGQPLAARTSIEAVAFSVDGRTIAAAGADGGLRLWDVATGRMLGGALAATPGALRDVSFNADGQKLATIDETGAISLWDPVLWSEDRDSVSDRLCAIASRNLTRSEWRQFLPGKDYRSTCELWPTG